MGRDKEIEEYIKEYRKERKEKKKTYLADHMMKFIQSFQNELNGLIIEQTKRKDDKIKFIYLYQVLSSIYTGSYKMILGMSNEKLYFDDRKSQVFWYPELIYENINQDMKEVEKLIRRKLIRLEDFELFYAKKKLLHDDWELLQESFVTIIKESVDLIINSNLPLEQEVLFLIGNYKDNLKIAWHTLGVKYNE